MINKILFKTIKGLLLVFSCLILLTSCFKKEKNAPDIAPLVSVISVKETNIPLVIRLSGRLEANKKSEVRARVAGVIKKRYFKEGTYVKEGQNLYLIDDAPMKANYNKAKANFNKIESDLKRKKPLIYSQAISKQEFETTVQSYQIAKAELEDAKINLTYAHITAPISGLIGSSIVTEGDLVGQTGATLLTTIQDTSIMKVQLYQSAQDVMLLRKSIADGLVETIDNTPEVLISFEDNSPYPLKGKLFFTDNTVNENTGQILLRAEIPNPNNILLPGLFVNVEINQGNLNNVFVVPKQSVERNEQGDLVIIVNKDGTYAKKPVHVIKELNNFWIINSGLKSNDLVLFEGIAKLITRPKKLNPQIIENPADKQINQI